MSALSAGVAREFKDLDGSIVTEYPVKASAQIYQGGLVMLHTGGYAVPAADTANCKVVGWADHDALGTAADGGTKVRVRSGCSAKMATSSTAITDMDAPLMYVVDDNTVDETSPANSVKAGVMVMPYLSTTLIWMFIPRYGVHTLGL